jgi:hypothetical protein
MMVIESYPFRNSSYGKGNNNSSSSSSSINNGDCNGNSNSVGNGSNNTKPIHYKQLVNYLPDDIISLFTTRGVIVECHTCKHIYVDRQARDYYTYDYSICPNCKGFNVLLPKDGNNNNSNKKKHSLILEREYYNASSAIPFLARKDIPSDARVEVTLTFNSKDDAIKFIAWLSDKVNSSSNSNSIKVLVTTH